MKTLTYTGFIREMDHGEGEAIFLSGVNGPLIQNIMEDINQDYESQKVQASVRFWISDEAKTKEQIKEDWLHSLVGGLSAYYRQAYSDYTGYLWTDCNFIIDGHDLEKDLYQNQGKYLHLEIDIA